MDTIDLRRDPCADAIARIQVIEAIDAADAVQGRPEPVSSFVPGRERPIKYMQHPAYRRFLPAETLAA